MSEIDLSTRFPRLKPVKSPPTLFRINGCGLGVYGCRDADQETGTYIKTWCLCFLWFPVLALGAYRVANADRGWYFIGREPLSGFSKVWNMLVLAMALTLGGGIALAAYTDSPEYRAGRQMAEAGSQVEAGQLNRAAAIYQRVARGGTSYSSAARLQLTEIVDKRLNEAAPPVAIGVFKSVVALIQGSSPSPDAPLFYDRAIGLVSKYGQDNIEAAMELLDVIEPIAADKTHVTATREKLLERWVVLKPDDADAASRLALIYESRDELDKCRALLIPHRDRLGEMEGARILGQVLTHEGDDDAAYALLRPYTKGKLKALHDAEEAYNLALEQAWERKIEQLNRGAGPESFYRKYELAGESAKQTMVDEYVQAAIRDDPGIKAAEAQLVIHARVVPVALDLGVVTLQRAQGLDDPDQRQSKFHEAEEVFLAIRGLAGDSDEYRLYYGQVSYWLGKQKEGRELFDQLLAAHHREPQWLIAVAGSLRQVGASTEARALAEEAYNSAAEQESKYGYAAWLAAAVHDNDERIKWLERCDQANLAIKASLFAARGDKAIAEGDDEEAARQLRSAIDTYARQTETTTTLNNGALAWLSLYHITGQREDFDQALAMLEKALTLQPSDSILLGNVADVVFERGLLDVIGDSIDLKSLKIRADLSLLSYLYGDQKGLQHYQDLVRGNAIVQRAVTYYEKVLLLSPQNRQAYVVLDSLHRFTENAEALRSLHERLAATDVDVLDYNKQLMYYYQGLEDDKLRKQFDSHIPHLNSTVAGIDRSASPIEYAVAVGELGESRLRAQPLGVALNADELVAQAQAADEAAPSLATHKTLLSALLHRAAGSLAKQDARFAEFGGRWAHNVGDVYLLSIAARHSSAFAEAIAADKDVHRVVEMLKKHAVALPSRRGAWEWALLNLYDKAAAEAVVEAIRSDPLRPVKRSIDLKLNPLSITTVFDAHWELLIEGDPAAADAVLVPLDKAGVPLP